MAQGSEDTIKQLNELLNPILARPVWACTNPGHAPRPAQVPIKAMVRTCRSTAKKSAADAYGWTYEHTQALLGDAEATGALNGFLNHMQGGRLHGETMKELNVVREPPHTERNEREDPPYHHWGHSQKIRPLLDP